MKKTVIIVLLLALMGGAMAQNQGAKEYVSVLLTLRDTNNLPQDTLNKYGVMVQTKTGRVATALIAAERYHDFLNANLVERVQPSTRVFLHANQIEGTCKGGHHGEHHANCRHHGADAACDQHPGNREDRRQHLIPEEEIRKDEAKGWYLGLMLGGSTNYMDVNKDLWNGTWYDYRGLNLEVRTGYQFNEWFGIRTGLQLLSKNYVTDLEVSYKGNTETYRTFHDNLYLQLPLMADFSVGSEVVRLHFAFGGFGSWWASQCRNGYVYVAGEEMPYTGTSYQFVEGYDNRWDAGLAGGLGLTLRVAPAWQLHFEGNYYHSLISAAKNPYESFNRTWTFGLGMTYHF